MVDLGTRADFGDRFLGRYGQTIGPRPIKPYMERIRVMRGTVWCPIFPSRIIWGK